MAGLSPDVTHGVVENMWSAQTSLTATLALAVGELAEGDTYAADGCRDMTAWLAARFAMSHERAGELVTVGAALRKLPHIAAALEAATISWDQARALVRIATPETDEHWAERALSLSVRQLQREAALANPPSTDDADAAHSRRELRFGRTRGGDARLTAVLPKSKRRSHLPPMDRANHAPGPMDVQGGRRSAC